MASFLIGFINTIFIILCTYSILDILSFLYIIPPSLWVPFNKRYLSTFPRELSFILIFFYCFKYILFKQTMAYKSVTSFFSYYSHSHRKTLYLWVSFLFIFILYTYVFVFQHYYNFHTHIDLTIYGNACQNYLWSSIKQDLYLLSDHFEPLLILFSPLCNIYNPGLALMIVQLSFFMIGGLGIYKLAKSLRTTIFLQHLLTFAYILFLPIITVINADFHLATLCVGILPWVFYFYNEKKYLYFGIGILLFLCLKESESLIAITIAVFIFIDAYKNKDKHKYIISISLFVVAGSLFYWIMHWVYPHFLGHESHYFSGTVNGRYTHLGGSLKEVITTIFTNPGIILKTIFTLKKIVYVFCILVPFSFVHLLYPKYLLLVSVPFALNLLTNYPAQITRDYHYDIEIQVILFITFIFIISDRRFKYNFYRIRYYFSKLMNYVGCKKAISYNHIRLVVIILLVGGFSQRQYSILVRKYSYDHYNAMNSSYTMVKPRYDDVIKVIHRYIPSGSSVIGAPDTILSHLFHYRSLYELCKDEGKAGYIVLKDYEYIAEYNNQDPKLVYPKKVYCTYWSNRKDISNYILLDLEKDYIFLSKNEIPNLFIFKKRKLQEHP